MKGSKVKRIVLYGCGDMSKQSYNIIKHDSKYKVVGFLDDNLEKKGKTYLDLPIFGNHKVVPYIKKTEKITGGLAAIGNNQIRYQRNQIMLSHGLEIITAIHPKALIDSPRYIGKGVIVEMGGAIHPNANVGDGVFVAGGSIIAHDSNVGDYSLIAGGVIFGGAASVGKFSVIGVGAVLQPYIFVGSNVVIGIGAAVTKDIPDNVIAYGVPAKIIRSNPSFSK